MPALGEFLSFAVSAFLLMGAVFVRCVWRCGLCGKVTQGNLVQFLLMYCTHEGDG